MSRSAIASVGLLALCFGAHAASLQYDVSELPAKPLSADERNYVSGANIDGKGRVLINVSINSGPFSNGEICHHDRCRRQAPKQQSAEWYGFNSSGVLVGTVMDGFDTLPARRRSDGSIEVLGNSGIMRDVNSAGVAVGSVDGQAVYFDTEKHTLPTLGGPGGNAFDITDDGLIVGTSSLKNNDPRAAMFHPDGKITNLGTLPGGNKSYAYAINSKGVVVGASNKEAHRDIVPVKFENGAVIELGTLGGTWGVAQGINKAGFAVGITTIYPGLDTHAFVHNGKKIIDLNEAISVDAQSQWLLYSAVAINDAGQIVANARRRADWASVALLLTPTP